jgi:Ca-activated chloride channel homolog
MKNSSILTTLVFLTSFVHAENAMLVLDASGSMWGTLENQSKIQIARETVAEVLKTWPKSNALGLVAYGHRRKGDCADIETLLPVAPVKPVAFQASVNALNPKGMTPISAAVQHAALALKSSEQKATVILVSDGEETCNLDPCQIARQLEADGIDFTAHVIGFDVPKGGVADRQLACLAKETGGRYVNAKNAGELTRALSQIAQVKPQVAPIATLTAAASAPRGSSISVAWTGPNAALDSIEIAELNTGQRLHYAYVKDGNPVPLSVPGKPGQYELRYRHLDEKTIATRPITVSDAAASLDAPASAPIDTQIEVRWAGPDAEQDTILLAKVGDDGYETYSYVRGNNPVTLTTPSTPGRYELRYKLRDTEVIAVREIEVTAK